eukprot:6891255-Prymnesium_polylepis.1
MPAAPGIVRSAAASGGSPSAPSPAGSCQHAKSDCVVETHRRERGPSAASRCSCCTAPSAMQSGRDAPERRAVTWTWPAASPERTCAPLSSSASA